MVKWDTVLLHNLHGLLAIGCPPIMNSACLMKMGWEMKDGKCSLWCSVLKGKYGCGMIDNASIIVKCSYSVLYQSF